MAKSLRTHVLGEVSQSMSIDVVKNVSALVMNSGKKGRYETSIICLPARRDNS